MRNYTPEELIEIDIEGYDALAPEEIDEEGNAENEDE